MWRIFLQSVRCPELKAVKMTRCSSHSWIQIVLNLVGPVPLHSADLSGCLLLEDPVSCGADRDEGRRGASCIVYFLGLLEHNLTESEICSLRMGF